MTISKSTPIRKPTKKELANMSFLQVLELNNIVVQTAKKNRRSKQPWHSRHRSSSQRKSSTWSLSSIEESLSSIEEEDNENVENGTKNYNEWENKPSESLSPMPPFSESPNEGSYPKPQPPKYALNLTSLSNFLSPTGSISEAPKSQPTQKRSVSPTVGSRYPSLAPNHNSENVLNLGPVVATEKYKPSFSKSKPIRVAKAQLPKIPCTQKRSVSPSGHPSLAPNYNPDDFLGPVGATEKCNPSSSRSKPIRVAKAQLPKIPLTPNQSVSSTLRSRYPSLVPKHNPDSFLGRVVGTERYKPSSSRSKPIRVAKAQAPKNPFASRRSVSPTVGSRYPSLVPNYNSDDSLSPVMATGKYNLSSTKPKPIRVAKAQAPKSPLTPKRSVSPTLGSCYPSLVPNYNSDDSLGPVMATEEYTPSSSKSKLIGFARALESETNVVTPPAPQKTVESETLAVSTSQATGLHTMICAVSPVSLTASFIPDPRPEQSIGLVAATPRLYLSPIKKPSSACSSPSISPQPAAQNPSVIPDPIDQETPPSISPQPAAQNPSVIPDPIDQETPSLLVSSLTPPWITNNQQATTPDPEVGAGLGDSSQHSTSPQANPLPPSEALMTTLLPVHNPDDATFGTGVIPPSNASLSLVSSKTIPTIGATDVNQTMESQWTDLAYSNRLSIPHFSSGSSRALMSIPPGHDMAPVDVLYDGRRHSFTSLSCEKENVSGGLVAAKSLLSLHAGILEQQVVAALGAPLMPEYSSPQVNRRAFQDLASASSPSNRKRASLGGASSSVEEKKTKMAVEQRIQKARAERDKKEQESLHAISVYDAPPIDPTEHAENNQESPGAILNHDAFATEPKTEEKQEEPLPTVCSASNWLTLLDQNDSMLGSQVDPRATSPQPLKKTSVDESSPEVAAALQVPDDKVVQACASGYHASGCQLSCETQNKTCIRDVEDQSMIVENKVSAADNSQQTSSNVKQSCILLVASFFFLLAAGIALASFSPSLFE